MGAIKKVKAKGESPPIFIVLQQGGSSREWYVGAHPSLDDAEAAIKGIKAHTYDALDPIQVPARLAELVQRDAWIEDELYDLLDAVVSAMACPEFSDLEPDEGAEDE